MKKKINWKRAGRRIAQRRALLGLTQSQLADSLGTDVQSVSKWENSRRPVGLLKAMQISEALGVDVEWLYGNGSTA